MLEPMPDLPGNVAGFTARGKVTGEDYEKVLIPIIEEKLKDHSKIRLLYHLDEGVTGLDATRLLCVFEHANANEVLHRTPWVHELALAENLAGDIATNT